MSKNNYEYKQLTDDDLKNYMESNDATQNEKDAVKKAFDDGVSLFSMKRYKNTVIISKNNALSYLNNDLSIEKVRYYVFSSFTLICLLGSIALNVMTFSASKDTFSYVMLVFSIAIVITLMFMVYDYHKNFEELKKIKKYMDTTPDSKNPNEQLTIRTRIFEPQINLFQI